ncbi:penicillin-binding protein 1C [Algoriphagus sp. 4150]|uniref:penicillin-binding protein 1C n=1 Tax=Algoriphagus sp. 4150 TaxID=2817756 RepID=UPI00285CBCAD|nr:penicillin-binding protein 1C [Algoriphagus sp. 4150]MDR7131876.1 penicillin-binding protein 1C [Algoriphagus sp. 4150]
MIRKKEQLPAFLVAHKVKVLLGLLIFLSWLFCLPKPIFDAPTSTVVESREGALLGARIAKDGQWRFPAQDSIPRRFELAIQYFEDEYFFRHPGFNPVAMGKAIHGNLTSGKRRGASTLTQQVIRLSRKNKKRTYFEKLLEFFQATRLEAGYSKREILNLYASHAPFGGNVVGLEAAAWRYFGTSSEDLSWGQSAALAVLPNAPALIYPGKNEILLKEKRDRLLLKLYQKGVIDEMTYELALLESLPGKPLALPDAAMHFTEKVRKKDEGKRIRSTLNSLLQSKLNQVTRDHHYRLKQNQIHNLAIVVLDVHTRQIIGYVGNTPTETEHEKYVDVVDKPRSTGSLLKPLLFASAMHAGELLPQTLLADVPTRINGYSPQNFDKKFNGAVSAGNALGRSLNVPAVRLLQNYGLQRFYNQLQKMKLGYVTKPADHYGLTLILGGAESSLLEVTKVYAGLASTLNGYTANSSQYRAEEFMSPIYKLGQEVDFGRTQFDPPVLGAGAIYKAFESLRETNRPNADESWGFYQDARPIAWKTGTSYGFKDAWAVGTTPDYAIGVWVGNADGEGRPGLTGVLAAAPVLFDVLKELPTKKLWFDMPYDDLVQAEVCSLSGHRAGLYCDVTTTEWLPAQGIKTAACPYHKPVFLNASGTYRVNSSCYPMDDMRAVNWFDLPPVMAYYFASLNPQYKLLPPLAPDCAAEDEPLMAFIYPRRNEQVILPKNFDENVNDVVFRLAHRNPDTNVYWYLDETFIGKTKTFHELAVVIAPGAYLLTVTDQEGHSINGNIEVIQTH